MAGSIGIMRLNFTRTSGIKKVIKHTYACRVFHTIRDFPDFHWSPKPRRIITLSSLCCAVSLMAPIAQSRAEDQLSLLEDAGYFADIPSIESVTRLPQLKSETPAGVTIIDSEMIHASGAKDLPDLFRMVPGFQVANARQDLPVVTYHGLGSIISRRMLLLIDGRAALSSFSGSIRWYGKSVSLRDIERIEVIRGGNTVAYGDNAFFATINIITRHASKTHGTSIDIKAGDEKYTETQAQAGLHFDHGDLRLTAGYATEDNQTLQPGDFNKRFFNLRSDWTLSEEDDLLLQLGGSETSIPTGGSGRVPLSERILSANYQQLLWRHNRGNGESLHVQFYHNYDERDVDNVLPFRIRRVGIVQVPVTRDHIDERYDMEIELTSRPTQRLRTVLGIGARRDTVDSDAYFYNVGERVNRSSRLFGNLEWSPLKSTVVNTGLLWEKNELSDTSLSPRLAVNYHINEMHTIRSALSRAKRQPSLFEELSDQRITYQNLLLNQIYTDRFDLENETVESVEFGYSARFPNRSITLDTRIYRDHVYDFIEGIRVPTTDRDGTAIALINAGDLSIDGLELELAYQPSRKFRLTLTNAFMRTHADGFDAYSGYTDKQQEERVPDYSGSLFMLKRLSTAWDFSLVYTWVGKMRWQSVPVDAYTRLDMRLSRGFRLGTTRGEVALVIQNAGSEYSDYRPDREMGTRSYASIELEF
jgi:iron complex outermembrane recepter protein